MTLFLNAAIVTLEFDLTGKFTTEHGLYLLIQKCSFTDHNPNDQR